MNDINNNNDNIGILDPEGKNPNPLTNKPYSDVYKEYGQIWSKFPAYQEARSIIEDIKNNNVILVISGTGSGKTVLFPKFALHALNYNGKITITLPKTIITKSSAEFAAKTLDVELGNEVGYQYRNSGKNTFDMNTKLLYMTDGTLVARLLSDPTLKEFDIAIIDEAHERKVNIDFLLYLLRNVLRIRPEFKLIIMSATINEEIFKKYYDEFKFKTIQIGTKPNYPIESIFLDKDLNIKNNEYIDKGIEIIHDIMKSSLYGDILFFVTSVNETKDVCTLLGYNDNNKDNNKDICVSVYSGMDPQEQMIAIDKKYYKEILLKDRKIIISTNVAESSLTIDGIKYVIDSGCELRSRYDINYGINVLEKGMITNAQARQRMGRTGRTEPGICYHLYTRDMMENKMEKFPLPSIKSEFLYYEILRLMALMTGKQNQIDELYKMLDDFIEPPNKNIIDICYNLLRKLELVDDQKITDLGLIIADLQMDPMEGIAIVIGYRLNCFREIISIIAMINATKGSMSELFNLPSDILESHEPNEEQQKWLFHKFNKAIKNFDNKYGDHIALLKIFNEYRKIKKDKDNDSKLNKWIYKHFLRKDILEKADKMYFKLKRHLNYLGENSDHIKESILSNNDIPNSKLIYRVMASLLYGYRYNHLIIKESLDKEKSKLYVPEHPKIDNIKLETYSFIKIKDNSKSKSKSKQKDYFYYVLFGQDHQIKVKIVTLISKNTQKIFELI